MKAYIIKIEYIGGGIDTMSITDDLEEAECCCMALNEISHHRYYYEEVEL